MWQEIARTVSRVSPCRSKPSLDLTMIEIGIQSLGGLPQKGLELVSLDLVQRALTEKEQERFDAFAIGHKSNFLIRFTLQFRMRHLSDTLNEVLPGTVQQLRDGIRLSVALESKNF